MHSHTAVAHSERSQVLLATACVTLSNGKGDSIKIRALLDQGSEISIVQESLVQLLHLPRSRASVSIIGVGARNISISRGIATLMLQSHYDSSVELSVSAFVLPRVIGPSSPMKSTCSHLKELQLADPDFATPGSVELIFGAGVYGSLLLGDIKRDPLSSLVAQHTILGWIVSGPVNAPSSATKLTSIVSCCQLQDVDLHNTLQQFWTQEDIIPSTKERLTPAEQACEAHFRTTHSRDETGRYVVRLPFSSSITALDEFLPSALRSFARVRKRIQSNDAFGELYFVQEYADLGHMTPIFSVPRNLT